jgi:hypothetical protein
MSRRLDGGSDNAASGTVVGVRTEAPASPATEQER